jgi:poly(3-hydroxyalkanoate) synthetase
MSDPPKKFRGQVIMADPFELWRFWSFAISGGLEQLAQAVSGATAASRPRVAYPIELSTFPTLGRVRIELATMVLLEQPEPSRAKAQPVLIVAPYSVHDASVADFAPGHSLAQTLAEADAGPVALTFWKSATAEMRDYGIDAYLSDLNVAIDDLGGRVSLVGLCQGGWLAAAYAARFPGKIARLVLAGAPIDLDAAESSITRALAAVPPTTVESTVAMTGGRISGALSLAQWSHRMDDEYGAEAALQCAGDSALNKRFDAWNARTVDLPGVYFLEVAEWLFRENRLARGCFPALGRPARLSNIKAPMFVLAAAEDEIVALPQALAVKSLCRATSVGVRVEPGRHLSLFMGQRTLGGAWREIGRWLKGRGRRRIVKALQPDRPCGPEEARRCHAVPLVLGKDADGQFSPADWT